MHIIQYIKFLGRRGVAALAIVLAYTLLALATEQGTGVAGQGSPGVSHQANRLQVGVDARQSGISEQPIAQAADLNQRIVEQIPRAVSFPVHGVETKVIPSETGDGSGYVVVLVPESDLLPHRSEFSGEKEYWIRSLRKICFDDRRSSFKLNHTHRIGADSDVD